MYADVLIIHCNQYEFPSVISSDATYPNLVHDLGYVIVYSQRYYVHQNALTQVDILAALQSDANQQVENWGWLYRKINDFEDKSLQAMGVTNLRLNDTNEWLKSIWDTVNALDITPFDDNAILSKMNDVITAINNINIPGGGSGTDYTDTLDIISQNLYKVYQAITNHNVNDSSLFKDYQQFLVQGDAGTWVKNAFETFEGFFYSITTTSTDWDINTPEHETLFNAIKSFFNSMNNEEGSIDINYGLRNTYNYTDWNGGYSE